MFTSRFMALNVSMPLEQALDLGWHTLAECFEPQELLMKKALIDKYYPHNGLSVANGASPEPRT
jgi:V/A-type H+-transporting ATPase subunit B